MTENKDSNSIVPLDAIYEALSQACTDAEFQRFVREYLVPTIQHCARGEKDALTVLTSIKKRLTNEASIPVPIEQLSRFIVSATHPAEINLANLFLEMGFHRSRDTRLKVKTSVTLLSGIDAPTRCTAAYLHMFASVAEHIEAAKITSFGKGTGALLAFIRDFFLATIPQQPPASLAGLPGLSEESAAIVLGDTGKRYTTAAALNERKVALGKFLVYAYTAGVFTDKQVFPAALAMACEQSVRELAEDGNDLLKKLRIDVEDRDIVAELYGAVLGDPKSGDARERRLPCGVAVQIRAFEYLSRSTLATNTYPHSVKAITQCLIGVTTASMAAAKLKEKGLAFTQWVMNQAGPKVLRQTGAVTAVVILKFIKSLASMSNSSAIIESALQPDQQSQQSQPQSQQHFTMMQRYAELEKYGFHAMTVVARKVPEVYRQDPSVLEFCIHSLSAAKGDLKIAVQSAIRNVAYAYTDPSPATAARIEGVLTPLLQQGNSDFEYAAAAAAIRVFPFGHPFAVYACLVSLASQRQDTRDEGLRGLRPYVVRGGDVVPCEDNNDNDNDNNENVKYPNFGVTISALGRYFERDVFSGKVLVSFTDTLHFLQKCLESSVTKGASGCELTGEQEQACREYLGLIKRIVTSQSEASKVTNATTFGTMSLDEVFHDLYELLTIAPSLRAEVQPEWLCTFYEAANLTQRENLSKCLAVAIPDPVAAASVLMRLAAGLGEAIRSAAHLRASGFCLGLGYVLYRYPQGAPALIAVLATLLDPGVPAAPAACAAIGLAARTAPEALPQAVAERLFALIKAGRGGAANERALCEAAVRCVGCAFLNERPVSWAPAAVDALLGLAECKSPEVLIAAGDALCFATIGRAAGNHSDPLGANSAKRGVFEGTAGSAAPDEPMRDVLTRVQKLTEGSQLSKTAGCTWLYSLVAHCGRHPLVQSNRCGIQECFLVMLTHPSEMTRDTAARGIVTLYETCPSSAKPSLIDSLMDALSSSSQKTATTSNNNDNNDSDHEMKDKAIFPVEGATLLAGRSELNPYRELSTLARELGRPELVYCLVSLTAGNDPVNGASNSRSFKDILARSRAAALGVLPRAFPLLFRGAYDADPRIAKAMGGVLSALLGSLTHAKRYLSDHFSECAGPLVAGMSSGSWRTALSSTAALADVLSTTAVPSAAVTPHVVPMLKSALRAAGHDKAAVRQAAAHALGALHKLTVRLCDPSETPRDECAAVLAELLPLLLPDAPGQGAEVRALSLELVEDICHVAGRLLEPHLVAVAGALIQEMSFQEVAAFNTVALRLGAAERDTFDMARGRLAADSPIGRALAECVQSAVSAANAGALCDLIAALALKAAGLPSRVGAAQCAILLCNVPAAQALVPPHAARMARSFIRSVFDESAAVRRSHANALACVLSLGSEKLLRSAAARLRERYVEAADSPREREACGFVFRALLKGVPQQKLVPLLADFVPIIVVGAGDGDGAVAAAFADARAELPIAGLHQFRDATADLALSLLDSRAWAMKARGAKAISELAKSVGSGLDYGRLLGALMGPLAKSKYWEGKEALLEALGDVCAACQSVVKGDGKLAESVFQCVVKEFGKKSSVPEYKMYAAKCVAALFDVFANVDASIITSNVGAVADMLGGAAGENNNDDNNDVEMSAESDKDAVKRDEEKRKSKEVLQLIKMNLLSAIKKGLSMCKHPCEVSRKALEVSIAQFFRAPCEVQCEVLALVAAALERQQQQEGGLGTSPVAGMGDCITAALSSPHEVVKAKALDALFVVFKPENGLSELAQPLSIDQVVELVEPIAFAPSSSTQLKHKAQDFISFYHQTM